MNIVADIGNSQIKIAIERKNGISRVKAFRSDDFKNIRKYLKALNCDNKPYLLTPGDAIVYHGSVPHYRKELKGDTCYQVFLHYSTNIKYKHHGRDYYKMYGKKSDE